MSLLGEVKYMLYGSASAVIVVVLVALGFGSVGNASAQVFNSGGTGCSVSVLAPKANAFTVSGNMASTTVLVSGPASCRETVSLSSWNAPLGSPNFRPFENQQFLTGKTLTLGPGTHTLSIAVNNSCSFQVDILLGGNQKTAAGNANFGNNLMGFTQVIAGVCKAPTPAPAPAQTPAAPATINNTNNNTTVVQQQQQQNQTTPATPAATEATPTPTEQATPSATTPSQNQQQAATTPEVSAAQSQQQTPSNATPATQAQPVFTCDGLDLSQDSSNNSVTITNFRKTANGGAMFTSADIAWGDGSNSPGVTTIEGLSHQFNLNGANSGTFTISAVAHFNVNGQDMTAGGPNCQKQITFTAPQTPTPTPTPAPAAPTTTTPSTTTPTTTAAPSQLVNTGPGSLLGIFGVSTILGTLGFRYFLRARLSRM